MKDVIEIIKLPEPNQISHLQHLIDYEIEKFENSKNKNQLKHNNKIYRLKRVIYEIENSKEDRYVTIINDTIHYSILKFCKSYKNLIEYCNQDNNRFYITSKGIQIYKRQIDIKSNSIQKYAPDGLGKAYYDPCFNPYLTLHHFLYYTKYYNLKLQIRYISSQENEIIRKQLISM